MNTNTTDKVQVGDSTTGTSTSTTWHCPYIQPRAEQGWECPRCGHINAPWVRQCDCSRSNWTITSDWTYKPEWMTKITCQGTKAVLDSDTFKVHPDSTIYQVGGSDYKEGHTYVNVPNTQSTNTQPDIAINNFTTYRTDVPKTYTTETVVNDSIHNFYNLKTSKETK